jgi:2-succinyl-5-enolpyruvyl-6-hydroxy-3-cyclohexene-1-carboxylate synthase
MSDAAVITLWVRSFVDELARAGVREVVVAPGSRSTPLVMAFAVDERFRTRVHLDERSASFFALGVGKATGKPAVVVTTSGTAVGNVLPAVIEASQGGVPMLVLTADRPHYLRDSDANQAIDQVGIFGRSVRAFFDVAPPTSDEPALKHLRGLAARAYASTVGPNAGPAHLNFPFDKPLEPETFPADSGGGEPVAVTGRTDGAAYTQVANGQPTVSPDQLGVLCGILGSDRGVIVAGPTEDAEPLGAAVKALALATGFPILADALSGARYGPMGDCHVVAGYDLFLRDETVARRLAPSVVLRVGTSPTSASLLKWLAHHEEVPQIVVDASGRWKDHGSTATHYVRADPSDALQRMAEAVGLESSEAGGSRSRSPESRAWNELWRAADTSTLSAVAECSGDAEGPFEGAILSDVLAAMPAGGALFVSNSMPIRDLDAFGHPREASLRVFANRGASGIDGILSTAFGVSSQCEGPTVCVVGDVAFFHDQNGLLWSREDDSPVVFVLIDNDGGGIFHMLPISEHDPYFTRYFATPHGIGLEHTAAAHGLDFHEVGAPELSTALTRALSEGRTQILCVRTNRDLNQRRRATIREAVASVVSARLSQIP